MEQTNKYNDKYSPFYAVYIKQKELFDQAIDTAIKESSEKMDKHNLDKLFSITKRD